MDINVIMELSAVVKSQGLSALEVDENGTRIRLENQGGAGVPVQQAAAPVQPAIAPAAGVIQAAEQQPEQAEQQDEDYDYITAPLVGVFCSLEKMGKPALKKGDVLKQEMVVCGIEAMKMVCDVKAETSGSFVELMVQDGDQVEFGQQLIKLKK